MQDDWQNLVGKFFHSFTEESEGRVVDKQGQILAALTDSIVVVRYFDWIVGAPSTTHLVWLRMLWMDHGPSTRLRKE